MKYSKLVLAATLSVNAFALQAENNTSLLKQELTAQPAEKFTMAKRTGQANVFGAYQLESNLVAVPHALAELAARKADIGNMAVVQRAVSAADTDLRRDLRANDVVRNTFSGELGVVTGNVTLLGKQDAVNTLIQQFDLQVVKAAKSTGVYIVKPNRDVDLVTLLNDIKASGLVKTARLDVLEKKYSTQ